MHADFASYLDHLSAIQKSPLTIRRYGDVLDELDVSSGGAPASALTRGELQRFAGSARKDGRARAPAGVNLRVAVLRAAFAYLVSERLCPTNTALEVKGIPEPRRTPKYLTLPESVRLLEHVAGVSGDLAARNVALVLTFWQAGPRVSELAGLRVGQIDREARLLRAVTRKGGHVLDVEVNEETLTMLGEYLASRGELAPEAPVFARRDGGRLSVRAIQALFEKWRAELGWTRALHAHVLRHTFATDALADGAALATVAEMLGHASIRTALVYAHVLSPARREALTKLGHRVPRSVLPAPESSETGSPLTPPENVIHLQKGSCVEAQFRAAA